MCSSITVALRIEPAPNGKESSPRTIPKADPRGRDPETHRHGLLKLDRSKNSYQVQQRLVILSIPCSRHAGSIREFLFPDRSTNAASGSGTQHARPETGYYQ